MTIEMMLEHREKSEQKIICIIEFVTVRSMAYYL